MYAEIASRTYTGYRVIWLAFMTNQGPVIYLFICKIFCKVYFVVEFFPW